MANNNSNGVSGSNVITGGNGNDKLNGGASSDTLNGGAGSDSLNGDSSNDKLIYGLAENSGATDIYTGGSGIDTVRIDLTQAEWMNAAVEYQLARYYQHLLTVKTNPKTGEVSNGAANDFTFDFGNGSKLTVQMMERLEIAVDGVVVTNQDQPVIKNGPQAAGVVEDGDSDASAATAQSASGNITFFDLDLTDSHVVSVATPAGAYGTLTASVSNSTLGDSQGTVAWSYQLNNAAVQFLAAGETRTEVFTVRIADANNAANFAETQITLTITGTNDVPVITAQDLIGGVTELVTPAGNLIDSGAISFSDVDLLDVHLVSAAPIGTTLGSLSAFKNTDTTGTGTGGQLTWTYSVAASAVEYLAAGQTKVESFTVTLDDQNGGVVSRQIDVTLTGTNDAAVITAADLVGGVTELVTPAANLSDSGTITFSDVDLTDVHLVSSAPVDTTLGSLTAVKNTDTTNSGAGGQLTWTYSVAASAVEYLAAGQTKVESFTVTLDDQNGGVVSRQVDVTLTGTNDVPIITAQDLIGGVTELVTPAGNLNDSGAISFSDVDLTDAHLVSAAPIDTTLGSLTAVKNTDTTNSGTGGQLTWTYSVAASAVEYLAAGQTKVESFTVTLDDQNGGVVSRQIDVTLTGTNDVPIITAQDLIGGVTELVTPAGNLNDSGAISFSDVDLIDVHVVSAAPIDTTLGSLSAVKDSDTTGSGTGGQLTWTYSVPASAVEYLAAGQTKVESFTISLDDQNGGVISKQIDITITGTNDAAVITAADLAGSVTELLNPAGNLTDSGAISFSDVDLTDAHLVSAASVGATLGSLTAVRNSDSTGTGTGGQITWTYSVAASAVEFLAAGQTKVESFAVSIDDQNGGVTTTQVNVTITGTNDVPVITAQDLVGSVTELVTPAGNLTDSGSISFSDVDLNDIHIVSPNGTPIGSALGFLTAAVSTDTTGSGTGGQVTWNYSVPASAVEFLAAGQTKVESFNISLSDQNGGVINRQVNVVITGTNDVPVITSEDLNGAIKVPVQQVAAPPSPLEFTVQQFLGYQSNDLNTLRNYASSHTADYTVQTNVIDYTDDTGGFAGELPGSSRWPAAVAQGAYGTGGLNDVFFAKITAEFSVTSADTYTFRTFNDDGVFLLIDNTLVISDTGYHPEVAFNGSIALTPGNHTIELFFFENGGEASLEFSARTSTGTFGLVGGTGGGFGGSLAQVTDSGVITFSDVDLNDVHLVSATGTPVGTTLGSLSAVKNMDTTGTVTGGQLTWTYTAPSSALVYLGEGQTKVESFTITLNDQHGGLITKQIDVTITGTNEGPVVGTQDLSGALVEQLTPNGVLAENGSIQFTDVDLSDEHVASAAPQGSTLGSLTAVIGSDTTGTGTGGQLNWQYTVDASAVEHLAANQNKIETFTVTLDDQHGGQVTRQVDVTITGTNDAAILGSAVANLVETDVQLTTSGTLSISDVDTGQSLFNAQSNTAGNYGNFSIAANGAWTYATAGALDNLAAGQVVTDVFNVTSVDGTSTSVTVNITGTADGPTAVDDGNTLNASSPAQNTGNTVYWADWQTITAIPGNAFGEVKVAGSITLPDRTIDVTYTGQIYPNQTYIAPTNTYNYWHSSQNNGATWIQNGDGVYTSNAIANGPGSTNNDFIALALANTPRNVSFSEPVANLFFAVASMNNNGYLFDQPFTVVSSAQGANDKGNWGYTDGITLSANNGQYGISTAGYSPNEFHGVLAINNAVDSLTWVSQSVEYWQGFTVGTYGVAQSATASGNVLGNDVPDTSAPALEVSAAGGENMVGNSVTLTLASGAILRVDRDGDYLYNDNGKFVSLGAGNSHTESVVYTVRDNGGNTDTGTLTITVNGVNDTAVLGTAVVNLTETDAALSTGGTLSISDLDAGEALFNAQNNTAGTYGSFSIAANGTWSYNTNGALDHLLAGQQVADVFNVTSLDGTATTVTVNITGTALHIAAPGNLAKNGSFENDLTDWATLAGGVDRVQNTGWQSGEGSYSLDLNAFSAGGVQQTLATQNGTSYGVFFQISKNYDGAGTIPSATMKVSAAGSTQNYTFAESNSPTNMMWRGETFGFTANSASTTLSFESLTSNSINLAKGPALDDVVVLANTIINGFDKADGDVLSLATLLSSIGAPSNATAFDNGYLRFQQSGSDTLVQVDANGGADDFLTAVTLIGVTLSQSDTGNYSL